MQCILGYMILDVQCLFSVHCISSHKAVVFEVFTELRSNHFFFSRAPMHTFRLIHTWLGGEILVGPGRGPVG